MWKGQVVVLLAIAGASVHAFQTPNHDRTTACTKLHVVAPTFIIGPMIKKMREKNQANEPQVNADEARDLPPGLRIGKDVWRWPAVWPYEKKFFTPVGQEEGSLVPDQQRFNDMASMVSGVAQAPTTPAETAAEEEKLFDASQFWKTTNDFTELDPASIEKLTSHYDFFLENGMSVLEFGAGRDSYLPPGFQSSRHVGVGLSMTDMDQNPALTDKLLVDLNKVVEGRDVDDDQLRRLAQEQQFDVILAANTVDYLVHPREVFRTAWYLLKPGGTMIVSFTGKDTFQNVYVDAQTKMWRQYNDDQHMWITGSFFHFSAGDGWERLLGFDISPETAKKSNSNPLEKLLDRGTADNVFVVQATKGFQDDSVDPENLERSIGSLCWMLPTLEDRDKRLLLPRLARTYGTVSDDAIRQSIERNIPKLPIVYESLIKMDTFSFSFSNQAQLACDLISDPTFEASEEQILELKQGLGLRSPSAEFWVPIGQNTANMEVEDRISLLGYVVPRFGSTSPAQVEAKSAFVEALKPTYAVIRRKCPELNDSDVELLGTELLATEILTVGRATREEFAMWLEAQSGDDLRGILGQRKTFRVAALQELDDYKKEKAEEAAQLEEYKRIYEEQIQAARMSRSLVFNPRTQKMEILENPNKK